MYNILIFKNILLGPLTGTLDTVAVGWTTLLLTIGVPVPKTAPFTVKNIKNYKRYNFFIISNAYFKGDLVTKSFHYIHII